MTVLRIQENNETINLLKERIEKYCCVPIFTVRCSRSEQSLNIMSIFQSLKKNDLNSNLDVKIFVFPDGFYLTKFKTQSLASLDVIAPFLQTVVSFFQHLCYQQLMTHLLGVPQIEEYVGCSRLRAPRQHLLCSQPCRHIIIQQ